jgi:hypothetical protein
MRREKQLAVADERGLILLRTFFANSLILYWKFTRAQK